MALEAKEIKDFNFSLDNFPRIIKYQIDKNKDFRSVNHKVDLIKSLDVEEVFGSGESDKGLLVKKVYKMNEEELFHVFYEYQFGSIQEVTHQKLVLKWLNENGEYNSLIKDKGFKTLSRKQKRQVIFNRRSAIIFLLEDQVMNLLSAGATSDEEVSQSVDVGATLMEEISVEIGKFKNSGHGEPIVTRLTELSSTYTFLTSEIAPGITVINYIANFLNY